MVTGAPVSADDALAEVYAQIPAVGCRGLCWRSCGPVDCGDRERERLAEAGVVLPPAAEAVAAGSMCPALSPYGRCTVYAVRPAVCRLWGAAAAMPCPHGCRPAGGLLPDARARRLLAEASRL